MNIVAKAAAITAGDDDDAKKSLRLFLQMADIVTATSAIQATAELVRTGARPDDATLARRLDGFAHVILQGIDGILAEYSGEPPPKSQLFH